MADSRRIAGERVYCHSCENEWDRDQGGLICPRCTSEFTEILSSPSSPTRHSTRADTPPPRPSPFSPMPHPLHNHNPWQPDAPDPDEDDITTFEFSSRPIGNGTFSFTSRTIRVGGGPMRGTMVNDPAMAQIERDFQSMLTNIMGVQPNSRNRGFPDMPQSMFPPPAPLSPRMDGFGARNGFPNPMTGRIWPPEAEGGPGMQPGSIMDLFGMITAALGAGPHANPAGNRGEPPPNPFILLSQLLNPANAAHGDAVFSQEALDRVISQLMEQNAGSTAPGPASESAINSLPTREVEASMLGNDGKAECSICMDNVNIGDKVTVLPCNHWFHGPCVVAWLQEHDTCPHCRQGITKSTGEGGQPQNAPNSSRPSTRRSSSVTSPRSPNFATREFETQGDRIRAQRQQHFERYGSRPESERRHTRSEGSGERRRSDASRTGQRGGSGSGSASGGGGGVTGWIRNHNPFS